MVLLIADVDHLTVVLGDANGRVTMLLVCDDRKEFDDIILAQYDPTEKTDENDPEHLRFHFNHLYKSAVKSRELEQKKEGHT